MEEAADVTVNSMVDRTVDFTEDIMDVSIMDYTEVSTVDSGLYGGQYSGKYSSPK